MQKIGVAFIVLIAAAVIGGGFWIEKTINSSASDIADNQTQLADFHPAEPAAIARGAYVMRLADCAACHTAGQGDFAGGYLLPTGFGTLASSNITPDRETGIGNMTERQFFDAVRQGKGSKGFLYPAMPYTEYRKISDADMQDLWAYMATVAPIHNAVNETAGMNFPFNIRLAMLGWDMLFFENRGFTPDANADALQNRGAYIVDAAGHCSACHTPRNILGAEKASEFLQGANVGGFAPDITSNPHSGIGGWSNPSIVEYLKTGANGTEVATGGMAEAVQNSTQYMTDSDLLAVATYLKSIPASPDTAAQAVPLNTPAMQTAALNYEVSCSACHGTQGEGMGVMVPAFAGNPEITAPDATNLVHAVLIGGRAAATVERPTGAGMPSFAWKFSDQQIADIVTYLRNGWGNSAAPVDAGTVADMRKTLNARAKLESMQH